MCHWADVLYAMDTAWWQQYQGEAAESFSGEFWSPITNLKGVNKVRFEHSKNSGAGAIALAAYWGAERVIMLGYDCQKTGGKAHWHKDHPGKLGNAGSVDKWPAQFRLVADLLKGLEIINCSRQTALAVFPRRPLEEVLK